jgi:phosphoglycerol transferase MdoB-like AlkP superfamily enzyme
MDNPFITSNYAQNNFESMASLLNQEGYNTSFYHGGIRGTMGFYSFSKRAGFTDYFGMEEYNDTDDFDGTWGIYDQPFMQFFANELNDKKEPFFSTFFSISSHPPYTLPSDYSKKLDKKSESEKIGIRETISYTDYSMRDFFQKSKNQEWFKNTIFIITADHTAGVNYTERYKNRIGRYTIPLIIFSEDSSLQGINTNTVQHIDIMPTVLELLDYNKSFFAFGKSMLSEESWAINFLQNEYRLITDSSIIINKEENYSSFSDWNTSKNNELKHGDKQLLKAIKQAYNNRMLNNKLLDEN